MLSSEVSAYVELIISNMKAQGAYFEEGEEKVKGSIRKFLTDEYEKEVNALSLKLDTEKARGLFGSDSKERYETEYKYMKQRFMNKINALGKATAQSSE